MTHSLDSVLRSVQTHERRNRLIAITNVGTSVLFSVALLIVIVTWYSMWIAAVLIAPLGLLAWWIARPGVRSLNVSTQEASILLDAALRTKERASTLVSLHARGADDSTPQVALLAAQLSSLLPDNFSPRLVAPYAISTAEKRGLGATTALAIMTLLLVYFRPVPPLRAAAAAIEAILQENPDISEPVRREANELLATLSSTSEQAEIRSALSRTKEAIERSLTQTTRPAGAQATTTDLAAPPTSARPQPTATTQPAPTPTTPTPTQPSPEPQQSREQQQPEKKEESEPQQGEEQGSQQQQGEGSSSKNDNGSEKSGSQGKQGEQESKQQGGQGQSEQSSKQQQSGGQQGSGSGSGSQGSSSQGDKQESSPQSQGQGAASESNQQGGKGSQKEGAQGAQSGSSGSSSGAAKLQAAITKLEQELSQGSDSSSADKSSPSQPSKEQGGDSSKRQSGSDSAQSQGSKQSPQERGASPQSPSDASGDRGEKGSDKQKPGTNDSARDPAQDSREDSKKEGKGSDDSSSRQSQPSQPRDEKNEKNQRSEQGPNESSGANSPSVDRNAKAREGGLDGGTPGPGLGGKERFNEVEIPRGDEKLDARFTGQDSTLEESSAPASPLTTLDDVTLAKPKPSTQRGEQPIPLEYRDDLR